MPGAINPDHAVAEGEVDELRDPGLGDAELERGIAQVGAGHVAEGGPQAHPDPEEVARICGDRGDGVHRSRQMGGACLRVVPESAGGEDDRTFRVDAHDSVVGFNHDSLDAAVAPAEHLDHPMVGPNVYALVR